MRGLVRAALVDADVLGLVVREDRQLGPELVEVQRRDLLVEVLREDVHLLLVAARGLLVPELELRDDLVGERARHDERGVASGAAQVEQAPLGEHDDAVAVGEDEAVALGLDGLALDPGPRHEAGWSCWEELGKREREREKRERVSFFCSLFSTRSLFLSSSLSQKRKRKEGKTRTHVDLVVKVADVADDGVVLHLGHVLGHDDVLCFF